MVNTAARLVALTLIVLAATADGAAAQKNAYSHELGTNCTNPRDPITVIWYGTAATTKRLAGYERGGPFRSDVKGHITYHMPNWVRHNTDNIYRQDAPTSQGCEKNPGDTDLATAFGYGNDRRHLRMWDVNRDRLSTQNAYTQTTPHYEQWVWGDGVENDNDCGTERPTGSHAVLENGPNGSGFDQARRRFLRTFRPTCHRYEYRYFGNTRSVMQCNSRFAGSNGNGLFLQFGRDATR